MTEPVAFLVTVFGMQDQAVFDPERLVIISRNRLFRPIAILPITPLWNQHRVSQRETAAAIYLFENGIAMLEPFTVESDGVRSDQWERSLRRIERERAKIANRRREPWQQQRSKCDLHVLPRRLSSNSDTAKNCPRQSGPGARRPPSHDI